ncbi:MAG: hypothetical protein IPK59_23205, partial [Rhodospirillaceae bacterium]|nr:hypothetical protein [Rhodospirillaceae bacterium]
MVDLERMRAAFVVAAVWQAWSAADQAEYGAQIRAAIEANDEVALGWWAEYLEQASGLEHLASCCRSAEARIKAS